MENVLLVIHLIACTALVFSVLIQRSEGGIQGLSGGGVGGLISGRGATNVLVRTTMILAAVFFTTSLLMTRINSENQAGGSEFDRERRQLEANPLAPAATPSASPSAPATPSASPSAINPLAPAVTPSASPAPAPVPSPSASANPLAPAVTPSARP